MPYDLRVESWIPYRRASGQLEWLSPAAITDRLNDDPVVATACPRADFDAAVLEFLIGLLSIAFAPEDEADWARYRRSPPPPLAIAEALARLPDAFCLDGCGPRFFQDFDPLEGTEPTPIENLLIGAAGEQSKRFNTDLFVKRDRVPTLGRPAAAMALLTMQSFAPGGGQGHRTSLRGGGPLSTLAEPRRDLGREPLWDLLWANVETQLQFDARDGDLARAWTPSDLFPWLADTRQSNENRLGGPTRPADAAPGQTYFGLPRRIRLEIADTPTVCALTGRADAASVAQFRMKNYGVQYLGWLHPLTPYYFDPKSGLLPIHGQPGGVGWRDWLGLLVENAQESGSKPAQMVAHFRARRAERSFRLRIAGYDVDNMKARGWVQAEFPAFPEATAERLRAFASAATAGAEQAASATLFAVKAALLERPKDAPGDYRYLKQAVWSATERPFFGFIQELAERPEADGPDTRERFRRCLRDVALAIFDSHVSLDVTVAATLRRPIAARHTLVLTLEGVNKSGRALFKAMNLSSPTAAPTRSEAVA